MAEKRAFHRPRIFYIFSGLLFLALIGFFIWRNYKYTLVNKKVETLVNSKSRGLYSLSYHNLVINEALGNVSVENVQLIPDSTVYIDQVQNKTDPDQLFKITIPRLSITGIKTPKALLNQEISAHFIRIENADIVISRVRQGDKKESDFSRYLKGEMYRELLGKLKSITADSVIVENASLELMDKESETVRCKITGISLRFADVAVDSTKRNDSSRILFSRSLAIHCNLLTIPHIGEFYGLQVSGLDFNSETRSLHTKEIRFRPLLSETDFAKANHFAKDRLDFIIGSAGLVNIHRTELLQEQFIADTLTMNNADFKIFRDKSYPHDSVDRTDSYPQQAIMHLPFKMSFSRLLINDSYVEYKEKNDQSDSSGKVAFFHVQAKLDNVTNINRVIRLNGFTTLHFHSSFLNETSFTTVIKMRINDSLGRFSLDANMGSLNAVLLNPLVKPMALAEITKGKINSLHYHLDATNWEGKGRLELQYENLSVKLIKKNDNKNKYQTKLLPTLAAGVILKDSNPQNGKMRLGQVDYTRDTNRSIFNMMWKSLFAAIKKTAL
jgi:hypothetical protein